MEFNKKVKGFFDSKGVKAKEVGESIGYSEAMMSRYVNAEKPNIEFIDRLVRLYPDADLNYLLKDDDQLKSVAEANANYSTAGAQIIEDIEDKLRELKSIFAAPVKGSDTKMTQPKNK